MVLLKEIGLGKLVGYAASERAPLRNHKQGNSALGWSRACLDRAKAHSTLMSLRKMETNIKEKAKPSQLKPPTNEKPTISAFKAVSGPRLEGGTQTS